MKRVLILLGLTVSLLFTTGCAFGDFLNDKASDINNVEAVKELTKDALTVVEKYQAGDVPLDLTDSSKLESFISKMTAELNNESGTIYQIVKGKATAYTQLETNVNLIYNVILDMQTEKNSGQVTAISGKIDAIASNMGTLKDRFIEVSNLTV